MGASLGNITKAFVSTLDPILDTREINRLLTDVYNEDELSDILGLADRKIPTKQPIYYTFYDDPIIKFLDTTSGSVSGSGSANVTLTSITAATSGYARPDDLVMFTNNLVGIIRTVTTSSGQDTITVRSVNGGNLTCTAGNKLSLFSRAMGENSTTPANLRYGLSKTTNKYQLFREASRITDIQNASTVEVEFQGKPYYFFKDQWEKKVKMKSDINAAFWGGDMSNTTFSDTNPSLVDQVTDPLGLSGSGPIQTTRGIDKYIDLYGTALVTNNGGVYTKGNLDDAVTNLIAARAPKEYLVTSSTLAKITVDTYLKNLGSSGVNSVRLVIDGKELDLQVDQLKYGGFTFNYMTMPILDHPVTFAFSSIVKQLYYLPYNNKVKVEGGGSDTQIRVRYTPRQAPFGDDMIGEIRYGAYHPTNPNGTGAFIGTDYITYQGMEVLAAQFLLKQQVIN
jgi:hypothetical protein